MTSQPGAQLYSRLFPVLILTTVWVGVATFAVQEASASLNCFIGVFFGIRLDWHMASRRACERRIAALGWRQLRGPHPSG
ncbi:hypothetical protein B5C34_11605 [Pacificimonas flava]|uniref:Uncharacterized protein n=2 Tax=Pacificimonas TaxID=1960290 RepID=A0A219B6M8_9SPHN|nr:MULTISPECIES: hypothetical protein [Pacificimonas]MBZ6378690.1 hypothetical protein [Pacificimonas aurantium]OWV34042.1 hypothetical protein B5C34_11605 [Pacificimonas flava]